MEINFGLLNCNSGWQLLLDQEGVSYEILNEISKIQHYQLLIIHSNSTINELKVVSDYIKNGGMVLFEASRYAQVFNKKTYIKKIKYLFPEENSIFSDLGVIDFYSEFKIIKGMQKNYLDSNLEIIWQELGSGAFAVIPFEMDPTLLDMHRMRKRFPAARIELPSELVAKVSKGKIRILTHRLLLELLNFKNIPYIQKWYLNSTAESSFLFRVDTDFCSGEDAHALYKILKRNKINATWFIDTESNLRLKNIYGQMEDQEIAFHCDRHRVFRDYKKNRKYITQGLEKLKDEQIAVTGYAAPFGEWNQALGTVLEDIEFEYSSEFSLDYDNLPFFPQWGGKKSKILQIPIHPVSSGRLRRAHFTIQEMVEYFTSIIDKRLKQQEPIIIYHHPSHKHFEVIEKILQYVNSLNLQNQTFSQLAVWWKYRAAISFQTNLQSSIVNLKSNGHTDFHIKVSRGDEYAIIPFSNKIDLKSLVWKKNSKSKRNKSDRNIRKFYWRDLLNNYESYKGKMRR